MKKILLIGMLLSPVTVFAGGWANTAEVTNVEIIRASGFQIKGGFGNASECSVADTIYIKANHPQYEQLLSTALAAFMGGKKLRIYSHQCADYGWHAGTHNELTADGSMYITN